MAGHEDNVTVLSDVEEEDNHPATVFNGTSSSTENVSVERFREVIAELDRERKAREAAENSKSELQVSFNRLKILAHEAIKKRDEISRQRDEVFRSNEELSTQLAETVKQLEESVKANDSSRSEIEKAAHMLVTGIDKISGKVSNYNNFMAGELPRSQKYTGLPAVAYGVIKKSNEIVEELLKEIESATKSTINELRDDILKNNSVVEDLEKSESEKDLRISNLETELSGMPDLVDDYAVKLKNLEIWIDSQRPLLVNQLNYISKLLEQLCNVIKILDGHDNKNQSDSSDSLFLPHETDFDEYIQACLAGLESISELSSIVYKKTNDLVSERNREMKSLNESVTLLRSALSIRMSADLSSKTNELFRVAENGLREAGIDYRFSDHISDKTGSDSDNNAGNLDRKDDEIYTLAGTLVNIIKQSQLEIIELQHTVDELRAETSILKDKKRVANENVEGVMMDIVAAKQEITRWKTAAQQEAEAARAVEQEYVAKLSSVSQQLEEAKQSVMESEKKLKFKEETAVAAMAARYAAENSLRLADLRATRLRDRVEELTSQLEKLDTRESQNRVRYVCWPWKWVGLNSVGAHPDMLDSQPDSSIEKELSEPLI